MLLGSRRKLVRFPALWVPALALLCADLACAAALFPDPSLAHCLWNLGVVPLVNIALARSDNTDTGLWVFGGSLLVLDAYVHAPYLLAFDPFVVYAREVPVPIRVNETRAVDFDFWWVVSCVVALPASASATLTKAPLSLAGMSAFVRALFVSPWSRQRRASALTALLPVWHLAVACWSGHMLSFVATHTFILAVCWFLGRKFIAHLPDEVLSPSDLDAALVRIQNARSRSQVTAALSQKLPPCLQPLVCRYLDLALDLA